MELRSLLDLTPENDPNRQLVQAILKQINEIKLRLDAERKTDDNMQAFVQLSQTLSREFGTVKLIIPEAYLIRRGTLQRIGDGFFVSGEYEFMLISHAILWISAKKWFKGFRAFELGLEIRESGTSPMRFEILQKGQGSIRIECKSEEERDSWVSDILHAFSIYTHATIQQKRRITRPRIPSAWAANMNTSLDVEDLKHDIPISTRRRSPNIEGHTTTDEFLNELVNELDNIRIGATADAEVDGLIPLDFTNLPIKNASSPGFVNRSRLPMMGHLSPQIGAKLGTWKRLSFSGRITSTSGINSKSGKISTIRKKPPTGFSAQFEAMDLFDIMDWLSENGIDYNCPREKSQREQYLRSLVQTFIPEDSDSKSNINGATSSSTNLASAQTHYYDDMKSLLHLSEELSSTIQAIPNQLLNETVDFKTPLVEQKLSELERVRTALETDPKSRILVFGDGNSGKSLFINLLLGQDLLFVSPGSSTLNICSVEYGDQKELLVTRWGEKDSQKVDLTGMNIVEVTKTIENYVAEVDPLKRKDRIDTPKYSNVKIKWPSPLLKSGIVMVDSPGLSEFSDLDRIVREDLPKASGTICLINSDSGINENLLQFLQKIQHTPFIDPDSIFFILTKLDHVDKSDRMKHRKNIWLKLRDQFHPISKDRFFAVNLKTAHKLHSQKLRFPEYDDLLKALVKHLGQSFTFKLEQAHSKLYGILTTLETPMKRVKKLHNVNVQERQAEFELGNTKLQNLVETSVEFQTRIESLAKSIQSELLDRTRTRLKARKRAILRRFKDLELPDTGKETPDSLVNFVRAEVTSDTLTEFKNEEHYNIAVAKEEFERETDKLFRDLFFGIREVELDLFGELPHIYQQDKSRFQEFKESAAPIGAFLARVAGTFASIIFPPLGVYKIVDHYMKKADVSQIRSDPSSFIDSTASHVFEELVNDHLPLLIQENFFDVERMAKEFLAQLGSRIDHNIRINKAAYHNFIVDDKELDENNIYALHTFTELAEKFMRFGVLHFRSFNIEMEDLEIIEKSASGSDKAMFTEYQFDGFNYCPILPKPVVLHKFDLHGFGQQRFLRDFLNAENRLRTLSHPNILKCHGSALDISGRKSSLYLVFEDMNGITLTEYFLKALPPISTEKLQIIEILQISLAIAEGLQYLHGKDLVHRNINPDSIYICSSRGLPVKTFPQKLREFCETDMEHLNQSIQKLEVLFEDPDFDPDEVLAKMKRSDATSMESIFSWSSTLRSNATLGSNSSLNSSLSSPFSSLKSQSPTPREFQFHSLQILPSLERRLQIGDRFPSFGDDLEVKANGPVVKISEFWYTKPEIEISGVTMTKNFEYVGPEVSRYHYDKNTDIFSFGQLLCWLWYRTSPMQVLKNRHLDRADCPVRYGHLYEQCRNDEPSDRPSWNVIIFELQLQLYETIKRK